MGFRDMFSSTGPRKNRPQTRGVALSRKNPIQKPSAARRVVIGSLLACLIVMLTVGGRAAIRWVNEWTNIQQITIVGLEHLSREEIVATFDLSPDSSLWSIDTDVLAGQLESHPWIRSVTFDRVLPHTLVIQVEERQPAAVLRASSESFFLDAEGFLLPGEITNAVQSLPLVEGMTSLNFSQDQDESHRRAKKGIHLAGLLSERFSGRPTVNVAYAHSMIVDLPRIRVKFGKEADRQWERFLILYPTIKATITQESQEVDLRFSQKVILRKRIL